MKRHYLLINLACLGLMLCLGFLSAVAGQGSEIHPKSTSEKYQPAPDISREQAPAPNPEADLKKAQMLLEKYEKELPRAKAQREDHILAELARLCFILGEWGPKADQKKYFDQGRDYAKRLCRKQPHRVAGHYWLALNLGGLAGMEGNLRLVPAIVKEMKIAAALDAKYNQAGSHRVLGRVYFKAPPWPVSVGNLQKSLYHLRRAVKLAPTNSTNRLFLAETLLQLGKTGEACRQLEKTLTATQHANWPSSLLADRQKARQLLQKCQGEKASFPAH
jgi:hypothetical protein